MNLIVANQFTTQLSPEIRDAVFGNIGTIVSFRIGQNDVESIGKYFQPVFDAEDLLRIPNFNTVVRTLIGGVPTQPFTMATLPQLGTPNKRLAEALKQLSAAKYGRPKAVVEKEIFARMTTKEEPKSAYNPSTPGFPTSTALPYTNSQMPASNPWARPGQPPASAGLASVPVPKAGGSFIDEWLAKKRTAPLAGVPASSPYSMNGPAQGVATAAPISGQTISQPLSPISSVPVSAMPNMAPASTPLTPAGRNISSNEIEQAEVDKIAGELRTELITPTEPNVTKEPQPKPTSGHMREGDTIHIGR